MSTEFYNSNWRMPKSSNSNKVSNYSMSFDGSSQYIDINPSITTSNEYSISTWINSNDLISSSFGYIVQIAGVGGGLPKGIGIDEGGGAFGAGKFYFFNGSGSTIISTTAITVNNWLNVVFIFNKTANEIKFYLNGNLDKTTTVTNITGDINSIGYNLTHYINAKLDHFAIFDYSLSASQITSLYGNSTDGVGNPMALSTKPVAYYKLGEKAAFNGSEYLVTNAASEVYSPYALDFDGTNDYISVPSTTDFAFGTNGYSISLWFKGSGTNNLSGFGVNIFDMRAAVTFAAPSLWIQTKGASSLVKLYINGAYLVSTTATINADEWYHILVTNDGTTSKIFLNGNTTPIGTGADSTNYVAAPLKIGGYYQNNTYNYSGLVSNFSIWNAALTSTQVTEIYNQGKPGNLNNHSAYSNLVSWWQLGENSSFDGTNWTVLDEKGTNNGTSVNMTEADLVNGVGTSANGLSSGMGGADNIIGDAPYSTANAVSYGMGVDALSTDVPS